MGDMKEAADGWFCLSVCGGGGGGRGEGKVRYMCTNKPSERERRKRVWVRYMRASTSR